MRMADGTDKTSASSRGKPKTTPKRGKRCPAKLAEAKARQAGKRKAPETKPEASQPETQQGRTPAQAVNPPPSQILGQIVWLAMHSPAHKHLFLTDLEWLVLPPLLLKQFRIFRKGGKPFAYASWAFVSEEVEERLKSGAGSARLCPGDWKCGEQALIIEILAPFGGGDALLNELLETVLHDQNSSNC